MAPIYEFECGAGHITEIMVKREDKPETVMCDHCKAADAKPIMSATPTTFRANDRKAFKRQGH